MINNNWTEKSLNVSEPISSDPSRILYRQGCSAFSSSSLRFSGTLALSPLIVYESEIMLVIAARFKPIGDIDKRSINIVTANYVSILPRVTK